MSGLDAVNLVEGDHGILDALIFQMQQTIPPLVRRKIDYSHWLGTQRQIERLPAAQQIYDTMTLRLPYSDIASLKADSFQELKQCLSDVINQQPEQIRLNEESRASIDPNSDRNILAHERDHFMGLPENALVGATVDVGFNWVNDEMLVTGLGNYKYKLVPINIRALSATEPKVLSVRDIELARLLAKETKDPQFIQRIEARIALRSRK